MQLTYTHRHYRILSQLFYLAALLVWCYKGWNGNWLHDWYAAALPYEGMDPFYWILIAIKVPQTIIHSKFLIWGLDVIILLSLVGTLTLPKRKVFNWTFTIAYIVYSIVYNTFSGHHYHSIGVILLSICFLFSYKNPNSSKVFHFARLYLCFMLASAFVWKLVRNNLFEMDHFSKIILDQNIYYFQSFPDSFRAEILFFLVDNVELSHSLWIGLMFLQASFALGFFTKRFDLLLMVFFILFMAGSWFFMNIVNLDNYTLILLFFPYGLLNRRIKI